MTRDFGRLSFFNNLSRREFASRLIFLALLAGMSIVTLATLVNALRWIDRPFPGFLVNQRMVLGGVGQYHWSGTEAGLNYPDKVVAANGKPLRKPGDLDRAVKDVGVGGTIRYTIERGGRTIEVPIRTMRFTLVDFLALYGIFFLAGVFYLVNVTVVFLLKPDGEASRAFFWTFFPLSHNMLTSFDLVTTHLGFIRTYMIVIWVIPFATIYLSLCFPERRRILDRWPALPRLLLLFPLLMAIPMEVAYPGPIYLALYGLTDILMVVGVISLIVSVLYSFFRSGSVVARQRAKVVLLGAAIAFPVPVLLQLLMSFGKTLGSYQVMNNFIVIPLLAFPISIAYAIARHNLFDVDVFIKRTVGYAIMTAIVGAGYFGLQIGLESLVLTPVFGEAAHKVTAVLFALLVVFLFNPLNHRVQDAVDRMFYRKKFDYKATVTAVSDALNSVLNLDEIVRKIVGTVHSEMFIDRSGLVLAGGQGGGFQGYFLDDVPSGAAKEIRQATFPADDPLVKLVKERKKLVTKYDVAEDPHYAGVRETCGKRFEELGASLAVPLVYQGELKAVLAVGHKKSGHFFTREDVELLQTLASHGAVAIENAHMAEQMKKEETVRTNLSRYLSPQIVDRIVQNDVQVNLGGDRKVVTVLFSDIRNFTTITENRPPDQLVHILNEYFTEMAQIIFENQGSLDKYIGDAIVAVFGSLIPLENPAINAVSAAVAMMKRLPELNRKWEARYEFYMNIGIGVNTGEVFLGNIGSPERMEFTVIGDAVNVASRFSGLAKAGQILVTKETLSRLGTEFPVRAHPPAEVKGKSGKLEVHEIMYTQSVIY